MATKDRAWAEPRGWPARNLGRTLRMPPAATLALDGSGGAAMRKQLTAPAIRARKARDGGEPLVMVTAYDAPGARMADEAGVDMIPVGDSVALVVLGYDATLQVRSEERRVGKECVRTCRSWWARVPYKKRTKQVQQTQY